MSISLTNISSLKGLLTRRNIQLATGYLQYALLGICVVLIIMIIRLILNNVLSVGSDIAEYENLTRQRLDQVGAQSVQTTRKRDYSQIAKNQPFGNLQTNSGAVQTKQEVKPISNLALELIGTFITPGQPAHAIIQDTKNNAQDVFEIDDKVFDSAVLVGIFADRVEINRNGTIEILKLDDTPSTSEDSEADSDSEQITVSETEVNEALNNLPVLLTQARAVPYFQDGKSVGLRLFAIKNESLYEKIGLLNGDILKTINGNNLGDITQAVKLFEQLRDERSISLVIERNRTAKTLQYKIQ